MVNRTIFTLAVLALLCVPQASADWLQEGGNGARTGLAEGAGPAWGDVAFSVPFPATDGTALEGEGPLVVAGRVAYTLYNSHWGQSTDPGSPARLADDTIVALLAAPLDRPELSTLATFTSKTGGAGTASMASDGATLFFTIGSTLRALRLPEGEPKWPASTLPAPTAEPSLPYGGASPQCPYMALDQQSLILLCATGQTTYLLVYDAATGKKTAGPWALSMAPVAAHDPAGNPVGALDYLAYGAPENMVGQLRGLSVHGGVAAVTWARPTTSTGSGAATVCTTPEARLWVVELTQGTALATYDDPSGSLLDCPTGTPPRGMPMSAPIIAADGVMWKSDEFHRCSTNDCRLVQSTRTLGASSYDYGSGIALDDGSPVVALGDRAFMLSADLQVRWSALLPPGVFWGKGNLLIAGKQVLGVIASPAGQGIAALDRATGSLRWTVGVGTSTTQAALAITDATLVIRTSRTLVVIGDTAVSLRIAARAATTYPPAGAPLVVQVGPLTPGLGAPTEFAVDWGDGKPLQWGNASAFEHIYSASNDVTARFFARNGFNQSASVPLTFHVGQHDPDITPWNHPFDAEYQNTSFFVLGLLATGLAALFGLYRTGRKRRRLHRELRALEADFKSRAAQEESCDAMLAERKSRARALFLERKLEEAHASFLSGRIDELRRSLRLDSVDSRLKFLPHGMVLHLQRLLADAHVDAFEREHFLAALKRETSLSSKQKADVTRLIDSWFARDTGA